MPRPVGRFCGLVLLNVLAATAASAQGQQPCARPVALFESVTNSVQLVAASTRTSSPAVRRLAVCPGDSIQVGDNSRAVLLILASNTPLPIDQNTEFVITESAGGSGSLIDLVRGALLFITRVRRSVEIRTPFVNASIEGTEFVVRAEATRSIVTVFEGAVRASNPFGELVVGPGQQAVAVQGQAPQLQLVVRPRDAVQWALYYEPLIGTGSFEELAAVPEAARDAGFYIRRASLLLGAGQLTEAREDLDRTLQLDVTRSDAYALRAIAAVALGETEEALVHGRTAVERDPRSTAARLALSYAMQSQFDLQAARDVIEETVALEPEGTVAWARLAELRLALDDVSGAAAAASRAASIAPDSASAQIALGFALLAQLNVAGAEPVFERAAALQPGNPSARLGLGLAKIRRGRVDEGRSDLEMAVALDPGNALLRSYLGKAYAEERRDDLAALEFEQAKGLDVRDPTPWFYDAIRKQALGRPVEALTDLQRSIELNDNRAVYRSRLLLDADLAARGARLGRVYRQLGFEQLALVEGWKSIATTPSDHAAHRLLADSYLSIPRHGIARDSELLQAQLLQPLNVNPVQPRLADTGWTFLDDTAAFGIGFNEFTPLFVRNGIRLTADGLAGEQGTRGDNLIASGLVDRFSYSVGQFHLESDGIRANNQIAQDIYHAFAQALLAPSTSAQVEFRRTESRQGDRRLLFFDTYFLPDQQSLSDTTSFRVGGRHVFAPASILIGSFVRTQFDGEFDSGDETFSAVESEGASFGEVRYLQEWRQVNLTAGVGSYRGASTQALTFAFFDVPPTRSQISHTNGYAYADVKPLRSLTLTGGLSRDVLRDGMLERSSLNPKVGITWAAGNATTIRAAAFKVFERRLISSQTIEPTNVAGFNQFFYDGNAAGSWRYGVGMDRALALGLHAGAEASFRTVSVPVSSLEGQVSDDSFDEHIGRAYLYAAAGRRVALSATYQFERIVADETGDTLRLLARSTTHRAAFDGRLFLEGGAFGTIRLTGVSQDGRFRVEQERVVPGADDFWLVDASLGYRLPGRLGVIAVEVRNLLDREFRFQDLEPEEATIVPKRLITVRLSVSL